ncbi:hypothetical protein [Blackfly microvirus SF02]|uniref:Uncharacterized protein n=1 Tax=Blackfly microvirus SF02 TaxID=2576452 RepID=A0A4P8PM62_9VIRU|nr:hypothetical protein [Blackfly microvirus SF02]
MGKEVCGIIRLLCGSVRCKIIVNPKFMAYRKRSYSKRRGSHRRRGKSRRRGGRIGRPRVSRGGIRL